MHRVTKMIDKQYYYEEEYNELFFKFFASIFNVTYLFIYVKYLKVSMANGREPRIVILIFITVIGSQTWFCNRTLSSSLSTNLRRWTFVISDFFSYSTREGVVENAYIKSLNSLHKLSQVYIGLMFH